ncbi:uncharacterized protein V1518DRAFT_418530 [Limtongia smithiae]|uniref:uncharacterized protein n=1 Tax=Limtongia smithiae TaxID=1125753 RepID=UPI0034CF2667
MPPRHFAARKLPSSGGTGTSSGSLLTSTSTTATQAWTSTFERNKDNEDAKTKKEREETQHVYEEFVKSFNDDGREDVLFVQSGTDRVDDKPRREGFLSSFKPNSSSSSTNNVKRRDNYDASLSPPPSKRRHYNNDNQLLRPDQVRMNSLMAQQAGGDGAAKSRVPAAVVEDSSLVSAACTLFLGGLPLSSTSDSVKQLVSHNGGGVVKSVKIQLRDVKLRGLNATVVLTTSEHVEKARTALDRMYLGEGFTLVAALGRDAGPAIARMDSRSGLPFNARMPDAAARHTAPYALRGKLSALQVQVQYPSSLVMLRRIHAMVENVICCGPESEAMIMHRERRNPEYAFLFDCDLPEHVYYRWKLWSIVSGEGVNTWSTSATEIFDNGVLWIPPKLPTTIDDEIERLDNENIDEEEKNTAGDTTASSSDNLKAPYLGAIPHLHLTLLLQHLSMRRGAIARLMAFAIDNAHAAEEIVDVICDSILSTRASTTLRVARLWAVGDILYNSGMGIGGISKGVWKYRTLFQTKLVRVFSGLHEVFKAFDGRIRADNFRRQIVSVLNVWEGWNVFTHEAMAEMTTEFMGTNKEQEEPDKQVAESKAKKPSVTTSKWKRVDKTSSTWSSQNADAATPIVQPLTAASTYEATTAVTEAAMAKEAVEVKEFKLEDLIDPDLDGEPMTDSDVEEDVVMEESVNLEDGENRERAA